MRNLGSWFDHNLEMSSHLSKQCASAASHLNKVQRVLNAAARLVFRAPRYCRITPLLYELHWLPVRQRISFKILLFVFKAIYGFAPMYLREIVSIKRLGNYN